MKYEETLDLYRAMVRDLELLNETNDELELLHYSVEIVRRKIEELERYISRNPVSSPEEQLLYFKTVYPMFAAELFYYVERYNLEKILLVTDKTEWSGELNNELKRIADYYRKNKFLFEYYRLGLTELDAVLFTSAGESKSRLLPEQPFINFSPLMAAAQAIAQIMAYEKFKTVLNEKLDNLAANPSRKDVSGEGALTDENEKPGLKWTGEIINLVELVYGLWLTGQIDHGNASRAQITKLLENMFLVRIEPVHRHFIDISRRKRLSQTKFLGQMMVAVQRKIDDGNGLTL